jgi:hypothetical protein
VLASLLLALAVTTTQGDESWDDGEFDDDSPPRVFLSAWGGQAWDLGDRSGGDAPLLGAEVAYAFDFGDIGLAGYGYQIPDGRSKWTPVALVRLTNRFQTRRGLEATFGFGFGAARPDDWIAWYQVALGVRLDLGPMFIGSELAFEQYDLIRLVGGLGVKF